MTPSLQEEKTDNELIWIPFEQQLPEGKEKIWLYNGLYAQTGRFLEKNIYGFLCRETGSDQATYNFKSWYPIIHPKV